MVAAQPCNGQRLYLDICGIVVDPPGQNSPMLKIAIWPEVDSVAVHTSAIYLFSESSCTPRVTRVSIFCCMEALSEVICALNE